MRPLKLWTSRRSGPRRASGWSSRAAAIRRASSRSSRFRIFQVSRSGSTSQPRERGRRRHVHALRLFAWYRPAYPEDPETTCYVWAHDGEVGQSPFAIGSITAGYLYVLPWGFFS